MKLIVHAGTGTVINADDDVYVIETDSLTDADTNLIEDGNDTEIAEVAKRNGRRISSPELELTYRNSVAFTPTALRQEVQENTFVSKKLVRGVESWLDTATDKEFDAVADRIMNDELLWQHYCEIVADAINQTFEAGFFQKENNK